MKPTTALIFIALLAAALPAVRVAAAIIERISQ